MSEQHDYSSCGAFTIAAAVYIAQGWNISYMPSAKVLRAQIATSLVGGTIDWGAPVPPPVPELTPTVESTTVGDVDADFAFISPPSARYMQELRMQPPRRYAPLAHKVPQRRTAAYTPYVRNGRAVSGNTANIFRACKDRSDYALALQRRRDETLNPYIKSPCTHSVYSSYRSEPSSPH
jgi:hypothetical protein